MASFDELVNIIRRLRTDCPWDREQTHSSLRHAFIEETYEAVDAIEKKEWTQLRGELGDVLLHVIFQSIIAEENNEFTLEETISSISEKLIRRHPHVFNGAATPDTEGQLKVWDKIKMSEGRMSVLEGIPQSLPALSRALKVQSKAAKVGFDWKEIGPVWAKVEEEKNELLSAVDGGHRSRIEDEFGDILFALVNYGRFLKLNPEECLRSTCDKFSERFRCIEKELQLRGKDIYATTLEEMDGIWEEAKTEQRASTESR